MLDSDYDGLTLYVSLPNVRIDEIEDAKITKKIGCGLMLLIAISMLAIIFFV